MGGSPGPVTILLNRVKQGEPDALAELVPLLYKELRRLAGQERTDWRNRAQFLAIAAQIMRRIPLQYPRRLSELDPRQARIAEMPYFGGLSVDETAEALGVSPRTVKRNWAVAKGWLHAQLYGGPLE